MLSCVTHCVALSLCSPSLTGEGCILYPDILYTWTRPVRPLGVDSRALANHAEDYKTSPVEDTSGGSWVRGFENCLHIFPEPALSSYISRTQYGLEFMNFQLSGTSPYCCLT